MINERAKAARTLAYVRTLASEPLRRKLADVLQSWSAEGADTLYDMIVQLDRLRWKLVIQLDEDKLRDMTPAELRVLLLRYSNNAQRMKWRRLLKKYGISNEPTRHSIEDRKTYMREWYVKTRGPGGALALCMEAQAALEDTIRNIKCSRKCMTGLHGINKLLNKALEQMR